MIFDSDPTSGSLFYYPGCGLEPKYPSLWEKCVFAPGPMGPSEGPRLIDYSGKNRAGAVWSVGGGDVPKYAWGSVKGQSFWAGQWDGADDKASVADSAAIRLLGVGDFSLSGWFWINDVTDSSQILIDTESAGGELSLDLATATAKRFKIYLDATAGESATDLVSQTWCHLVGQRRGSAIEYYLNGIADGTSSNSNSRTLTSGLTIGRFNLSALSGWAFGGRCAGIRCYSRYLLTSEISILAKQPLAAYEVNDVPRYWSFAGTSGVRFSPWIFKTHRQRIGA